MYLTGADIGGIKLEDYAKSIEKSNQMLILLDNVVEFLRKKLKIHTYKSKPCFHFRGGFAYHLCIS